jgi:hypothetical protein
VALGFYGILPNNTWKWLAALQRNIPDRFTKIWNPLQGLHQRLLLSLHGIWWSVFSVLLASP